jgi:uncharacterized membrane protein YphA (DoxX/SURF4 family)
MTRIMNVIKSDRVTFVLRLLIGALILYVEVPKLADIEKYSVYAVYSFRFFPMYPENIARFIGLMGPYLAILIGLGLIFGILTRISAAGWILMCFVFIIMKIDVIFVQGRVEPCYCFPGLLANMLMTHSIWIDVLSIPLSLQIILANRERKYLAVWSLLPDRLRQSWLRYIW